MVEANEYVPVDKTLIPTGKIEAGQGHDLRFHQDDAHRRPHRKALRHRRQGLRSLLCADEARDKKPTLAAKLRDPKSGRMLTVSTDQPGIQFYTGNFLFGQKGKDGKEYKQRSAVCLETGGLPDAVNQPTFPSIIVRPGDVYRHTCVYAFSAE